MEWINYHHLLYFWYVAREGGVSRAAEKLHLRQPTISAQIKLLEDSLGGKLFERQGRRLALTDTGRTVYRYADEIFGIGQELLDAVKGRAPGRPLPLIVGVANAVPKLVVQRLLQPALAGDHPVHLVCREDSTEALLAGLVTHALDVIISDVPAPPHVRVKVFHHLLGESEIGFFAAGSLAGKLRKHFPQSLTTAPVLLPTGQTALRRALDQWFDTERLRPRIVGEFDDPALMTSFGETGEAAFPAPIAIAPQIGRQFRAHSVGRVKAVRERYYAISIDRRLKHPGVVAITKTAKTDVFA